MIAGFRSDQVGYLKTSYLPKKTTTKNLLYLNDNEIVDWCSPLIIQGTCLLKIFFIKFHFNLFYLYNKTCFVMASFFQIIFFLLFLHFIFEMDILPIYCPISNPPFYCEAL